MSIPIIVGVTGHRDLRPQDLPVLRKLVRQELEKLKIACPHSPLVLMSSFAAGADILCAQEAQKLDYSLVCPLPFALDDFRKDFSPEESKDLDSLLGAASDVFVAPDQEQNGSGRHYGFRQAGIYIASHCHVLLALWDGSPAKPGGCGTAEAVGFLMNGSYHRDSTFQSPNVGAVIHIQTPRIRNSTPKEPRVALMENEPGCLKAVLQQTDAFNRDCEKQNLPRKELFSGIQKENGQRAVEQGYSDASILANRYQKRYLRILRMLSTFCVSLVMAYLLYDEADIMWMLPVYAVVLVLYYLLYQKLERSRIHEKYLQYRMLAECLRVQSFLMALGIVDNVAENFTWTQKHETAWVREAVGALLIGKPPVPFPEAQIHKAWIDGQLEYHRSARLRNAKKRSNADRVSLTMMVSTLLLFAVVCVLEALFPHVMPGKWLGISLRSWLKILWGSLSAVTLFVAGYHGTLSFDRKIADNEKMAALFASAARQLEDSPENSREIYRQLAREEIIENGNWISYCRENRPGFSI